MRLDRDEVPLRAPRPNPLGGEFQRHLPKRLTADLAHQRYKLHSTLHELPRTFSHLSFPTVNSYALDELQNALTLGLADRNRPYYGEDDHLIRDTRSVPYP